ncbi:MAG: hypothetical protein WC028_03545 [Candidatus Obscuribacterales bacterium]
MRESRISDGEFKGQSVGQDMFINKPDWLWDKHCAIAKAATGELPLGFFKENKLPSAFLMSGPGVKGKTYKDFPQISFLPLYKELRKTDNPTLGGLMFLAWASCY